MNCFSIAQLDQRGAADFLVIPFWEKAPACDVPDALFSASLKTGDFAGKLGETLCLYNASGKEPRVLLLGLGSSKTATCETLRRSFAAAVRAARTCRAKRVNFCMPHGSTLTRETILRGVFEGIFLTNYAFSRSNKEPVVLMHEVGFIGMTEDQMPLLQTLEKACAGTLAARDLVNANADEITPEYLASKAEEYAKSASKLHVKVLDKKGIEQEKMGLLLAVNRGSNLEPRLIELSYRGAPNEKQHIVLVGKGITYDTGGLSLKPTEGMLTMKCDMAGAAAVLATVHTAAKLGLKINVTAIAPCTENAIDGKSYKPGDVYLSHSGKTVEITNTDAEGRLVLADAMSYALKHLHPTCMIDVATLTGSIVVALGDGMSGLFTSDEPLAQDLLDASSETGELLWRMPLNSDYKEALSSEIADFVNCSRGKEAGSITAALFLQEFVGEVPWAHIDIAGPAFLTKGKHYYTTQATGYGVRLLSSFLAKRSS